MIHTLFDNPNNGDLHLKKEVSNLKLAKRLPEVPYDIDSQFRTDPTDFGADENL